MPFKKGQSGNPNGRPKAPEIEELRQALRIVRKRKGNKPFLIYFVELAYKNPIVAVALAKKLLPDKIQGEGFSKGDKLIIIRASQDGSKITTVSRQIPV